MQYSRHPPPFCCTRQELIFFALENWNRRRTVDSVAFRTPPMSFPQFFTITSSAPSVLLPTHFVAVPSPSVRYAVELRHTLASTASSMAPTSARAGTVAHDRPPNHPSVTVILFSVSVPVLSEQIAVAPPMVSHAASTRTKLLSCIIFFML